MYGLVIGVVVGAFLHLDAQLFGLWWFRARYRRARHLRRERARGRPPDGTRVLGLAAVQLNFWVNTLLASGLSAGSLSALNYAWLLMLCPKGSSRRAWRPRHFPLSRRWRRGASCELRRIVSDTLRAVCSSRSRPPWGSSSGACR